MAETNSELLIDAIVLAEKISDEMDNRYGTDGVMIAQVAAMLYVGKALEAQTEQLRSIEIALINYATQQRT